MLLHREQRLSNAWSDMQCWQGTILGPVLGAGTAEPPEVPGVTQRKAVTLAMHRGGRELVSCGLWKHAGLWRQGVGTMRVEQCVVGLQPSTACPLQLNSQVWQRNLPNRLES